MPLGISKAPPPRRQIPRHVRAVVIAALAAVSLALAVGTASANSLAVSEDDFRMVFPELTFSADLGEPIICAFTLAGSFHGRTITKSSNTLIGHITSATVDTCQGDGDVTLLTETLPWPLVYESFFEELPAIEGINLRLTGGSLQFEDGIPCLFNFETTEPRGGIASLTEAGLVESFRSNVNFEIDLDDPGFFCSLAGDSRFSGTAEMTDGSGEDLFVELVEVPTGADLRPSPESVTVEELEASDTFTIRNTGGSTATIDRVEDQAVDEFDVSGCGATSTIRAGASCVYTVQVDERPLASGRVTIEYDNGLGSNRSVSVDVDIAGVDRGADLRAEPSSVTIEELEQNDIVEITNNGGGATATIDRVTTTTTDTESPEFAVTTTGCGERLADAEACHYLISVNSRPEASGRITVEYDDGDGADRRLVIEVDIVGPDPAEFDADPAAVTIERLESNDSFTLRNISPDTAALINRTTLTSDDTERPEFSVTGIGCPEIYVPGASCTYVVSVNSRPEADGRYAIEFDDGAGNDRTVTVEVDIAS